MLYVIVFIEGIEVISGDLIFFRCSVIAETRLLRWQKMMLNEGLVGDDGHFGEFSENCMFIGYNKILVYFEELEVVVGKTECYFLRSMSFEDFFWAAE